MSKELHLKMRALIGEYLETHDDYYDCVSQIVHDVNLGLNEINRLANSKKKAKTTRYILASHELSALVDDITDKMLRD